jgi:UDP-glucose 4-epimerase
MRNVLVTGGAGFIGSNLVALLQRRGHGVTVLDNLTSGHRSNLETLRPAIRFVEGDVRDPAAIDAAMEGADAVFHLAASVGNARSIQFPIEDSEINVLGTLKLLEAARRRGIRKVVFSSSAGIFGELKTLPIKEDHPVEPDSPYGASKLGAEKLCLAYAKLYGMECVCLRYFNVYGIHQRYDAYGNVIPIFVERLLRGQPIVIFGDGEQTRDFVNVADVVEANYRAGATAGAWGAFNIASGTRISINALAKMIAGPGAQPGAITHGPPRAGDVRHSLADVSAAHAAFGYAPSVTLEEGLPAYVNWARAEAHV